jgi:hypothetical protein
MEMYEKTNMLSNLLQQITEGLDIPESRYLEAKKRYEAVGEWLGKDESSLASYKPEIYPQGSFRLGTVIKPISNKDEYDVDLVCYLADLKKEKTSQKELKRMIGDRLRQNETYTELLDVEGQRCWTLNYANEFHMDILPAIADEELRSLGGLYLDAVLITDKKMIEQNDSEWPKSNPKGYAEWFLSRQKTVFLAMQKQLAESLKASIDDIPDYKIKTPLQRAVQILKRHRDIYFLRKRNENKPISIIITTLAAHLYEGQGNVYSAIYDILNGIGEDSIKKEGIFYIPNPVNPEENFADKWDEDPALPVAFFEWIKNAKEELGQNILLKRDNLEIGRTLEESLGIKINDKVINERISTISPVYVKVNTSHDRRPWSC